MRNLPVPVLSAVVLVCVLSLSCQKAPENQAADKPVDAVPSPTNAASAPVASPDLLKLVGKWERPDGGYVLAILNVDGSGKMEAQYFNPRPINVSKALAIKDAQGVRVFVELRDVNYPGSTYSLSYDPVSDQLHGEYFQAAMRETYDVTFARLKE